ncbi:MAG: zf-TFIIB domain-containing protein [Nostocaceae cyanobacterium]|nr:zf-TFIIB domain-containing protein [Nostocaceae cyanobacterium]
MRCPKCRTDLLQGTFRSSLGAHYCPECVGIWISAREYEPWQAHQPQYSAAPQWLAQSLDVQFKLSPHDGKAALCPECNRILSRTKVSLKTPFYLERCANCGGIWCDGGEWEVLEHLELHASIPQLCSQEWQVQIQKYQQIEKDREALVERFGVDLADLVFALADNLEHHPHADFAVAYLVRRISK